MSLSGQYRLSPPSTLTAAQGHPQKKGSLQADTWLLQGSLIPLHTAVFCYIRLGSSLPWLSQHPWGGKGQRLDKQTVGVQRDHHTESCCFSCTLEMQQCRVHKTGYLWTRFLRLFYCKEWRTSCLSQWSSVGSQASGLLVLPLYRIFLERAVI